MGYSITPKLVHFLKDENLSFLFDYRYMLIMFYQVYAG